MNETIAIVHEIKNNPHYNDIRIDSDSPHLELVAPSEINRIISAFKVQGYKVKIIDGPWELIERANEISKVKNLIVFNKSRGFIGLERKIYVPAICQLYGIKFVGSSAYDVTLARHKYHTNRLLKGYGFKVPRASIYYPDQDLSIIDLDYPIILKPNHESGSLGISTRSVFNNSDGIKIAIKKLFYTFKQPVIAEEFIDGEEWKLAVIGNGSNTKALGCVGVMREDIPIVGSLQTRDDLVNDRIQYYKPEKSKHLEKAYRISIEIHRLMRFKDYSRYDYRIGEGGELVCMEISTHPDLGESSSFIAAAMQSIENYELIVESIIDACRFRYHEQNYSY